MTSNFVTSGTLRQKIEEAAEPAPLEAVAPVLFEVGDLYRVDGAVISAGLELAGMEAELEGDERAALGVLVVVSLLNQQRGSTHLPLEVDASRSAEGQPASEPLDQWLHEIAEAAVDFDGRVDDRLLQPDQMRQTIDDLLKEEAAPNVIGSPGEFKPLQWDGRRLYQQQLASYENRLVELIDGALADPVDSPSAAEITEATDELAEAMPLLDDGTPMALNDEQWGALEAVATSSLALVSGGPGTGKTSVVVSILRLMARLGLGGDEIALAAPTGKAANRLGGEIRGQFAGLEEVPAVDEELIDQLRDPQTLHRLLGYSPSADRYHFDEQNPLGERLVIVDEASMIDLYMMRQLFGAVADGARLVLVGDADQLPSVENGAVFRDLVPGAEAEEGPTAGAGVRLETSYRMKAGDPEGAAILETARAINDGEMPGGETVERVDRPADLEFGGVEWLEGPADRPEFWERWYREFLAPKATAGGDLTQSLFRVEEGVLPDDEEARLDEIFRDYERAQLLSLTRVFETGTEALNRRFHRRYRRDVAWRPDGPFTPGEPVMMMRNDYELGLFNGDQGIVCRVDRGEGPRLAVAFRAREGFRLVDLGRVWDDIQWSFAMTVHKSQGSEFEHVGLVVPDRDVSILTREILYTGLTRASRSVALVGRAEQVELGVSRALERHTAVRSKLRSRGAAKRQSGKAAKR